MADLDFTVIDPILDKLQLLVSDQNREGYHDLIKLKVELKLLKTSCLCQRRWIWNVYMGSSSKKKKGFSLSAFHQHAQQLYSLLLRVDDGSLNRGALARAASEFREIIKGLGRGITESYVKLSNHISESISRHEIDCITRDFKPWNERWCVNKARLADRLLQGSPSLRDQFLEFFDYLLENLVDFLIWGEPYEKLFEPLQEKLIFLKNFIRFALLRGAREKNLEDLLIHCEVVAIKSARLCYTCWFDRDANEVFDGMPSEISELILKIEPADDKVREIYIQNLANIDQGSSLTLSVESDTWGDFVDSLPCKLWKLLNFRSNFMASLKHQMQILCEGLKFLRNILKKQPEKLYGRHEEMKDNIGIVVNDAGILIFSLYQHEMEESLAKEIDLKLFRLLEKIMLIKEELEEKNPVVIKFNFPKTNELGFIDLLLEHLKELARCEVDLISFAKERVQTIQEDCRFLKSFLESHVEQHNQHEKLKVQVIQEDLAFLRTFLENNLENHTQHAELQALWHSVIEVAYKAEFVFDSLAVGDISYYSLMLFNSITEEIKLLRTDALEIDDNKNVSKDKKAAKVLRNVPLQSTISTIKEVVIGLEDEANKIVDQLTKGSMELDIISIVGMPGLGKTTLAKKVYNDAEIILHFDIRAWCSVSQVYCKKDLLLEILACTLPENFNQFSKMNEDDLADKLFKQLKRKRYLMVLDDVWDVEAWNGLNLSFPKDNEGSRILLTSRMNQVALQVKSTGKLHPLRRLTDDESWELLQEKLGGRENYPPALSALGRQIAKNCNGLPLSVVIISGVLATLEQDGWEEVAQRLSSHLVCSTEECMNILEMSYRHLPDYLKPCLLYFGAFLEDQEIPIQRLTWLWIAEGFVQKEELKSLENIAEDNILALISRSLVMVAEQRTIGGVKTCRIHDLLHEFCVAKAKEENFLQLIQGCDEIFNFDEPHNLRRLSIYSQPKDFAKSRLFCLHIRSLLFTSHGAGSRNMSWNVSFIFRLKLLRVLDLGKINLGFTFPNEIAMLVQLRYLAVLVRTKGIPSLIGNLSNLETFLVTAYCFGVDHFVLPDVLWNMQKLRHLHVHGALVDLSLAKDSLESSSNLDNLDTFSTPELHLQESMEKILKKFANIRKLKCSLLESKESVGDCNKIVAMDFLSRLESLKLLLNNVTVYHIEFHLPKNLKKLTLADFSWSIISTVGKLPNLEVLKLLHAADEVETWEMEEVDFPKLKFLKLQALEIVKWRGSDDDFYFPLLQKLMLEKCYKLEELPSCLGCIPTLESIEVHWCPESLGSLVRGIEEEHRSMGNVVRILVLGELVEDEYLEFEEDEYSELVIDEYQDE